MASRTTRSVFFYGARFVRLVPVDPEPVPSRLVEAANGIPVSSAKALKYSIVGVSNRIVTFCFNRLA